MGRRLACLLLLFLLAGCKTTSSGVPAAETALRKSPAGTGSHVSLRADGRTVIFRGEVTYGTTKELVEVIKNNRSVTEVHLTSEGGFVHPALFATNTLQLRGATTFVPSECTSACTLLFLGGEQRYLAPGAKLGFHRAWQDLGRPEDASTADTNKEIRRRLLERGVSPSFVARVMSTPGDEIWYPTPDELIAAGVIDGVLTEAALPR